MVKEKIKLSDITEYDYPEDIDGYSLIKQSKKDFDAEKGFLDYECVIKRDVDNKFFKFTYTQFGYNGSDMLKKTAVEVFPKEVTTIIYE